MELLFIYILQSIHTNAVRKPNKYLSIMTQLHALYMYSKIIVILQSWLNCKMKFVEFYF